jgi:phosphatidylserine decarboxylase
VSLGDSRESTPSINKTLNPEWNVTFELPIVGVPLLECVCWDKDRFGKDYMGEFDLALEDIFADGQVVQEVRHPHSSACFSSLSLTLIFPSPP